MVPLDNRAHPGSSPRERSAAGGGASWKHDGDLEFFYCYRNQRSLTPTGRALWVLLIGANAIVIGVFCAAVGAWPVLPFAGLEVALVAFAFHWIGRGDEDLESIEIRNGQFRWYRRHHGVESELVGNAEWAKLIVDNLHGAVSLAYGAERRILGQYLPRSERKRLIYAIGSPFRTILA